MGGRVFFSPFLHPASYASGHEAIALMNARFLMILGFGGMDSSTKRTGSKLLGYVVATLSVAVVTVVARSLPSSVVEPANLVMLYLLAVVGVALRHGRGPAVFCALLGVLAFDFFCVPPHLSFAVSDVQYLFTFAVMLLVGMLLTHLTAGVRHQADLTSLREQAARRLYVLAQELAGCADPAKVCHLLMDFVTKDFGGYTEIWWEDSTHALGLLAPSDTPVLMADERGHVPLFVASVMESGQISEYEDLARDGFRLLLCPLDAPMRRRGVLAVTMPQDHLEPLVAQQLASVALLAATTLERLHYVDVAQGAMLDMERERLRSTILSALSHDLRTPLTVMVGRIDALCDEVRATGGRSLELAQAIRSQVVGVSELTDNLLDLARLQSGKVRLRQEWQSVEEIVGAALAHLGERLDGHVVEVDVPCDLPLVEFDAVLMERVLCNLIDNAVRYGAKWVRVVARVTDSRLGLTVEDDGPGLPAELLGQIFEPFVRGPAAKPDGLGLGLSICRLIVEAHGGQVQAQSRSEGGARFTLELPRRNPPLVELEESLA